MKVPMDWLPDLLPVEYFSLAAAVLHEENWLDPYSHYKIVQRLVIGCTEEDHRNAVERLVEAGYMLYDGGFLAPKPKALRLIDPNFKGANAGGPEHRRAVWLASLHAILRRCYANAHTGRIRERWPDVFRLPALNPFEWDERGVAVEVELSAHEHPKRIVKKFNVYTHRFRIPVAFYVPDPDIEYVEKVLLEKTNALVFDRIATLEMVGDAAVVGLSRIRSVEDDAREHNFITEEPLNAKGEIHPRIRRKFRANVEDEGWRQREIDMREAGTWQG